MNDPLLEAAPGFDQPIAMLKYCHDRIRRQLQTMQRLSAHLASSGPDVDSRQAARAVLRYFNEAGVKHHQDEEHDLLPMLDVTARGEDAAALQGLVPELLHEHQEMEHSWEALRTQLEAVADGRANALSEDLVQRFASLYTKHMEKEEAVIAPMAKRVLNGEQIQALGAAMRARRELG